MDARRRPSGGHDFHRNDQDTAIHLVDDGFVENVPAYTAKRPGLRSSRRSAVRASAAMETRRENIKGRVTLRLSSAIVDSLGNALAGEFNQVAPTSGDGLPGGAFEWTLPIVPGDLSGKPAVLGSSNGDANLDGRFDSADLITVF